MKKTLFVLPLLFIFSGCADPYSTSYTDHTSGSHPGDIMTNSIGMKLVYIPAGDFMMGSHLSASQVASRFGGKADRVTDEHPQHKVSISKGFWMGQTEVTQAQWESVMGTSVRQQRDKAHKDWLLRGEGGNYPMYYIRWDEAAEFCRKLSKKDGRTYTLPTEAQWEYACRAGTTMVYSFGNNESNLDDYAWYSDNSGEKTHPVGLKKPNTFGLYDMHGNMWEWCLDWYDSGFYSRNINTDPLNNDYGDKKYRVLRGGGWHHSPYYCRSADRHRFTPAVGYNYMGFRVVMIRD